MFHILIHFTDDTEIESQCFDFETACVMLAQLGRELDPATVQFYQIVTEL